MKYITKQRVYIAAAVIWMIVIFMLSAQDAVDSSGTSDGVSGILCRIFVENFDNMPKTEQEQYLEAFSAPVRKCAHAAEYCILTVLLSGAFGHKRRNVIYAWLIAVLYAVSDEIHQIWVPGRSGELHDVLIDSAGGLVGVIAVMCRRHKTSFK